MTVCLLCDEGAGPPIACVWCKRAVSNVHLLFTDEPRSMGVCHECMERARERMSTHIQNQTFIMPVPPLDEQAWRRLGMWELVKGLGIY